MTDRGFERANDESRARLASLVETLRPAQLAVDLGGGWTVASALAHVGFWDRWQAARWTEMLHGTWAAQDESVIAAEHLANASLDPYLAAISAPGIPAVALEAATRLDALISGAPDATVEALEGSPSAYMLHRHRHRGQHLDQIERGLEVALAAAVAGAGPGWAAGAAVGTAVGDHLTRNEASRAQLSAVIATMSDADLSIAADEGGWTIGQVLGHLSLWDRFLAARWRAALAAGPGAQPTPMPHDLADLLNDALPPTWSSFSVAAPRAAVADTLDAAEAVDRLIATLPGATPVATIMAERPALLDRSIHRLEHIRTIERARQRRPR
jgi:hypothetical protein